MVKLHKNLFCYLTTQAIVLFRMVFGFAARTASSHRQPQATMVFKSDDPSKAASVLFYH